MGDDFGERFLKSDTRERLRIARDPDQQDNLRTLLGNNAFEDYKRLAGKVDEGQHLGPGDRTNVIFVPGVMGSLLQSNSRGGMWWIDARTRDRIDNLKLSPDGTTDVDPEDDVGPATSDPSYDPFLVALMKEPGLGHTIFPYDWRKSLRLSAERLKNQILDTYAKNGGKEVHVVAHSMGGLMTRAMLMEYGSEVLPHIGKIVFIATPHFGSPAIAGYLKNHMWGHDMMVLLGRYLSRPTFRSLYGVLGMLPAPRGIYPGTRTNDPKPWVPDQDDADAERYLHPCANFDLYQADEWRLDLKPDEKENLQRVLDDAKRFHQEMIDAHLRLTPDERRKMLVIAGVGYQSLFRFQYEVGIFGEKAGKVTARVKGNVHREGDGRVPVASAALDKVDIRFAKGEHGSMPNIPAVYREVFRFLKGEPLELPKDMNEAMSGHLAPGGKSDAPHLDGSDRSVPVTDVDDLDPGYLQPEPADDARLSILEDELASGQRPEFARLRIL
ncbi:hypothetical protein BB934_45780 (plasmid) [Microvirga ossetica]|uniref:AB hydrolase-1 domain-containing protein n=1 Tax=Microvirga ossetica TaxID=1882682 RepID=A0A1B2F006_9HYPH|nr:alpha/beta fold hydrolase [Microvirga ossetica]ANY85532.1 hypothetical protein BB934_45780 [Microvirga ossetica]